MPPSSTRGCFKPTYIPSAHELFCGLICSNLGWFAETTEVFLLLIIFFLARRWCSAWSFRIKIWLRKSRSSLGRSQSHYQFSLKAVRLQQVYCSIRRHGQRVSFLSDDKVLCQRSVNETILGEFQSKMIVFWAQYGVLLFPLNRP